MAKGIYIGSVRPYAGKTMLTIGMGLRFQKEGIPLGYMKPVGCLPTEKDGVSGDEDMFFVRDTLGLDDAPELMSPVLITQDFHMRILNGESDDSLQTICDSYYALEKKYGQMMVAGTGHMLTGKYCGLNSLAVINALDLKVVIVDRLSVELNYDILMGYKELLGDRLIGTVLNDIPNMLTAEVNGLIRPFLERHDIPVLGVIPHDSLMSSIQAGELAHNLGGRLITAQNKANRMVENFLIGTMQVENFATYFRRHANAAVLVGGDRADLQLVAIEGECPCLILTGNLYPNDIILSRAETLGVPIVMVREDTYSIAKKMEQLLMRHKLRDVIKIRQVHELINSNIDFQPIRSALGL